jgi:hypothetical protein
LTDATIFSLRSIEYALTLLPYGRSIIATRCE